MKKRKELELLVNSLKYKFFKVIYLLLKDQATYRWFIFLTGIVQYFQYTYLNFGKKIQYVWGNAGISKVINTILKYFTITIDVNNIGYTNYLTIMYLFMGLVILAVILILLLAFVIKNKRIQKIPLVLLKFLLKIILTFGFWPILRMQVGFMACQQNKAGKFVMTYQLTKECWTSDYYIHAVFAIIGLIITIPFATLMAFLTYESRGGSKDAGAMRDGRCYVQLLLYIFVQILIYQLLEAQYTGIIIAVFFIGSALIFKTTYICQPYFDPTIQKLWSILTGINFWTIIMMLYSAILDGNLFVSTIKCWLIGMPLIAGILLAKQNDTIDLMVANFKEFQDGDQVIKLCDTLGTLLKLSEKCQRSQILLDGYLEIHKQVCPNPDCSVILKEQLANKFPENPLYSDRKFIIKELINQLYYTAVKKFPDDTELRLNYVYFLYNENKNKQIMLFELTQAAEYPLTLDQEFHIYRYKCIIGEDSCKDTVEFDISASQRQGKDLTDTLEQAALQIIDFWVSLTEEIPDMDKLMIHSFKMQHLKIEIEKMWKKIEVSPSLKILNFMAHFYTLVLHDDEMAIKYQNDLQILQQNKQQELDEIEEICNQSIPTLVSTAQFEKVNIILVNKSLCSLLGYSKTDLLGRSINQTIPEIYVNQHNLCLENFIANKDKTVKNLITQIVYLKTKSNYILPVYSSVTLYQSANTLFFVSRYQKDFSPKQQCTLLLNNDGFIQHISSSCISHLNLDIKRVEMKKINIKELFPDFFIRKTEFLEKSGGKICLTPRGLRYSTVTIDTISIHELIEFQCYLSYIIFPCLKNTTIHGMIIRLERIRSVNYSNTSFLKLHPLKQTRTRFPTFQYAPPNIFQMDYVTQAEMEAASLDISVTHSLNDNQSKVSKIVDYFIFAKRMSQSQKHSVHYDNGIKTKRYWQGAILDIEDDIIQMVEEDEEQKLSEKNSDFKEEEQVNNMDSYQTYQLFQSKQSMSNILSVYNIIPVPLRILKLFISITLFSMYILGLIVFLVNLNDDQQVNNRILKLSLSNKRVSSYLMISTVLQDMRLINYWSLVNGYAPFQNLTKANFELLDQELIDLQTIHNELIQNNVEINPEYQQYQTTYDAKIIELSSMDGSSENYTYKFAIESLISRALALNQGNQSKFNDSDADFFYFNYNALNSITKYFYVPQEYQYYQIKSAADISLYNKVIFLIVLTILQLISFSLIASYLIYYNSTLQKIYVLFFEIQDYEIKMLITKSEQFLGLLTLGEDEQQDESFVEQNQKQQMEEQEDKQKKKMSGKKRQIKWKNSNNQFCKRMVSVFYLMIFIQAYFIYQYYSSYIVVEDAFSLSQILNITSLSESQYRYGDNIIREYFVNPNTSLYCNNAPRTFIENYIEYISDLNAQMQTQFTEIQDLLKQNYLTAFQQIYLKNPCPTIAGLQEYISENYCETFFSGTVGSGLSVAITKYFESLRILLQSYDAYADQESDGQYSSNNMVNYGVLIQLVTLSREIRAMNKFVLRYSQRYLIDLLEQSVNDSFSQLAVTRGTLFSCFTVYLLIIGVFVFIPYELMLIKLYIKSRTSLLFIPMKIMMKSPMIRDYIRSILKKH